MLSYRPPAFVSDRPNRWQDWNAAMFREGTPHLDPSIPLPSRLLPSQCFTLSPRFDSHLSLPACFQRSYYLVELRVAFVSESDLPASLSRVFGVC